MNTAFRQFVELFNQQKYFEAHEVLEDEWRIEKGIKRNFYQGMIQIAAVMVHMQKGNRKGAEELLLKAAKNLASYEPVYEGISIDELLSDVSLAIKNGRDDFCLTWNPKKN